MSKKDFLLNTKRIEWLDYSRGICAFCVLIAHNESTPKLYISMISPFVLMLFFFISGYLYKDYSVSESLKRLLNGLLLPYLALNFIQIALGFDNYNAIINGNYNFVINKFINVFLGKEMWFIPCLIFVQIYYIIISKLLKIKGLNKIKYMNLVIGIVFLFSVYLIRNWNFKSTYWYADNAVFALAYFILGNYFKNSQINLCFKEIKHIKILAYIVLILFFILAILSLKYFDVEFHVMTNYYENPLYFIFISLIGITSVLFFSMNAIKYNNHYNITRYLILLGQNSLLLFAFDSKTRAIVNAIFVKLNIRILIHTDYIYSLLFSFMQGVLIILLSIIVNKYLPYIVGKKKWIN